MQITKSIKNLIRDLGMMKNSNSGKIDEIILEERRSSRRFMSSKEESVIKWEQIIKIGDDIILVDNRSKKM